MITFVCVSVAVDGRQSYGTPNEATTVTYREGINIYRKFAEVHREVEMREMGLTDSGEPLHLVLYSESGEFDLAKLRDSGKAVFLINNAIHAGEPDGVDASIRLLQDLLSGTILKKERKDLVLAIIPFYNIGGVLNRNSSTRVNQNGPEAYGFRGNARYYDLNRDFIKGDTRNAQSFWGLFQEVDPDFFLDTHVSNGADYQYAITLIATQKDKLSKPMRGVMEQVIKP
ncbi:MAG: M14 family zinc carboxypeptidase, partial [Bacteroidota bacterium]